MYGILMATAISLEMVGGFFGPTGNKRKLAKGFWNSNKLSLKSWLLERVWNCCNHFSSAQHVTEQVAQV